MSSEIAGEPILFVRRFLEREGAVIEPNQEGFEAVLPQSLSKRLDLPEYVRIKEEADEEKGQYSITYGSPLLEKVVELSCDPLPMASVRVSFPYMKSQGFERLIQDQFRFRKSLCKATSTAPIKTDYLVLACRYVARSDEQKEGMISLAFHFETGARIPQFSLRSSNAVTEPAPLPESSRDGVKWKRILKGIETEAQSVIGGEIRDFRDSMNRRLGRDVRHLEEYFETLGKEMERSLGRAGLSERLVRDRKEKIALIPEELAGKKEDLLKKYSIRVRIIPAAAIFIRTPAVKILCDLFSGREKRSMSLIYNPISRALDPVLCEGCGRSTAGVSLCARRHILCARCQDKCPACK